LSGDVLWCARPIADSPYACHIGVANLYRGWTIATHLKRPYLLRISGAVIGSGFTGPSVAGKKRF
jgi:hypothetical protein